MTDIRRRLDRIDGGRRQGGVYVIRTPEDEKRAKADAAARGDMHPVLVWRRTRPLD
jgi:hypothetical protein